MTADGDGTVPLSSQKQQADTFIHTVLGAQVPIYVQCGVGHMAETEDPGIQARLQAWISDGKPIPPGDSGGCTASGDELNIPTDPSSDGAAHDASAPLTPRVPGALTLEQAQVRGLAQVLTFPDHQIVLTDSQHPVDLALPPGVHDLTVTPLSNSRRGRLSDTAPRPRSHPFRCPVPRYDRPLAATRCTRCTACSWPPARSRLSAAMDAVLSSAIA